MIFHFRPLFINFFQIFVLLLLVTPVKAQERPAPEIATDIIEKQAVSGESFMAVTSHPLATQAAYDILAQGGTAADAGIAAQLVLGLVEPQSSGFGGGAFALYYEADSGTLTSWDGRETAPAAATADMFLTPDGETMAFYDAATGGLPVGVPGVPALLNTLHREFGALKQGESFEAAIRLAEEGFAISPRLAGMIAHDAERLALFDATRAYFLHEDGHPKQAGERLRNPAYAETLRRFRESGARWFYQGEARTIAGLVQAQGGRLTAEDFAVYEVKRRAPVCGPYRGYRVCSMGEPSSGGLTVLYILGLLEGLDMGGALDFAPLHNLGEASRLAFADRNKYMADPDHVDTPGTALLDPAYLAQRRALILNTGAQTEVSAGFPGHEGGTAHISVVDAQGNILSMTTTVETAFGSKVMTPGGYLLNNQLTDFDFEPGRANSPAPGKRPRSSMAPVIAFGPDGSPFLVIGSAGGSRIIGFVAQRLVAMIDWGMAVDGALAMPHALARSDTVELEPGLVNYAVPLQRAGHEVKVGDMNSGLTAIHFKNGVMHGAADPRREGLVLGR